MTPETLTPDEIGVGRCPEAGSGCHGWMYGAANRLVAAGYQDDFIEPWIEHWMARDPQPSEIENTLVKIRAELNGSAPAKPSCSFSRPRDEEAIKAMTAGGPMTAEEFSATSPVPLDDVTPEQVLTTLFPNDKTILFRKQKSQGQMIWHRALPVGAVDTLFAAPSPEGAFFLVNPVSGQYVEEARLVSKTNPKGRSRRCEECITQFRHVLVESDSVEPESWLRLLSKLIADGLPVVSVTFSGKKSIHAIVRLSSKTREEWVHAVAELADRLVPLGADPLALTAVRLSRLPFVLRGETGKTQHLLWLAKPSEAPTTDKLPKSTDLVVEKGTEEEADPTEEKAEEIKFPDIYYDGKNVFMLGNDKIWRYESAGFFTAEMKARGYSDKAPRGAACSRLDLAKAELRRNRRVDGAGPILYHPDEVWTHGGRRYLNIATVKIMPAAEAAGPWGDNFPRYARILDNVFLYPDYLEYFLAWFKRFYESAEAGNLSLGQIMILVGPVQCFKSFIIERMLRPAMGGYADLSAVASGDSNGFNAELFSSPLAVIDDTRAASSEAQLARYSSIIKKLAAHGSHTFHEKYVTPMMLEWKGRVVIAANDDPVSIRAVPSLEVSNEDKIIALGMRTWEKGRLGPKELMNIEAEELPHFLTWLKSWTIPEKICDPSSRYGICSMIAAEVRDRVDASGRYAELADVIHTWWTNRPIDQQSKDWIGTTVDLQQSFNDTFANASIAREWPAKALGPRLSQLAVREGSRVTLLKKRFGRGKIHLWKISPPDPEDTKPVTDEEEAPDPNIPF